MERSEKFPYAGNRLHGVCATHDCQLTCDELPMCYLLIHHEKVKSADNTEGYVTKDSGVSVE